MYYHVHDGINAWSKYNGHTGATVIVLRAKISPYYNVLHEAISSCFHGN